MRAREVARPTDADLAEAERDLVIVRRNYTPADPLPARGPRGSDGEATAASASPRTDQDGKSGATGSSS